MMKSATLLLYGTPTARELAKLTLENQPQIRRIDATDDLGELKLFCAQPVAERELVAWLAESGISGFRVAQRQTPSRSGFPSSL